MTKQCYIMKFTLNVVTFKTFIISINYKSDTANFDQSTTHHPRNQSQATNRQFGGKCDTSPTSNLPVQLPILSQYPVC